MHILKSINQHHHVKLRKNTKNTKYQMKKIQMLHIGKYCIKSSLGILKMCVLRSSSEFQNYSIISKYLRHHKNKINQE